MTPSTVATWALNGSTQEFDVPFDYLSQTFVKVTLIGTSITPLTLGTDYQFITPTRIRTFTQYGPPTYLMIEIRRETSTTDRLVEFHDASILTAVDLNVDSLQVLHVAEEARNAATESISVNGDGNLDARGRRIVNLAAPRDPLDAVTKGYVDTTANGVGVSAAAAAASAQLSKNWASLIGSPVENGVYSSRAYAENAWGHANNAQSSATNAAGSASSAANSASSAGTSATSAHNNALNAQTHANNSAGSASASSSSASAAANSAWVSSQWAVKMDGAVEGMDYSAKYWASVAQGGVLPNDSVTRQKVSADIRATLLNMDNSKFTAAVSPLGNWAVHHTSGRYIGAPNVAGAPPGGSSFFVDVYKYGDSGEELQVAYSLASPVRVYARIANYLGAFSPWQLLSGGKFAWQSQTKVAGTNYVNDTGHDLKVRVSSEQFTNQTVEWSFYIDGVLFPAAFASSTSFVKMVVPEFTIPNGSGYQLTSSNATVLPSKWHELRLVL